LLDALPSAILVKVRALVPLSLVLAAAVARAGEPPELQRPPALDENAPPPRDPRVAESILDEPLTLKKPLILGDPSDRSKEAKIGDKPEPKLALSRKIKECCGYPIGLKDSFRLSFYWVAYESEYASLPYDVDIYTKQGYFLGRFPSPFVFELKLEGSGILNDGRVINYDGECNYGMGTCFKTLDPGEYPFGAGVQNRKLIAFKSIAVDPRLIPIGATVYVPELVGIALPDGTKHDGCLRADDQGGAIKNQKLDFFVESYNNFKFIADNLWWHLRATPHLDEPRCEYLRANDIRERNNDRTDWALLRMRQFQSKLAEKARASMAKMKRNRAKAQAWLKRHYTQTNKTPAKKK
jgi:3D (Asp-Asp-Asp) domain-containing protein